MAKRVFGILVLLLTGCQSTSQESVVNYETQGNLQSHHSLACLSMTQIRSSYTPADLFSGLTSCVEQQQFDSAADMYLAAMSNGYFDTRRVVDRSAHQAVMVLRMNTFAPYDQDVLNLLLSEITQKTTDNSQVCGQLKNIGMPTYHPTYMIQHGMGAFTEQKHSNGLINNFDADLAWQEALKVVSNCPKS
ncbi:hypothetical protein [Aliiglaciecola lipolytica]|uniref:Lipoprotein n=1 Tax=Aliiglaciecola lipolytica E3 TaxID=1127673 RepID=K6YDF5_9ALTE|nr:hypothetical protein [Aliiglaciecola lipolytica]GAC16227.1 hypothetical protein GLIP_3616 [Aliiglaciecola lipolytica E3]